MSHLLHEGNDGLGALHDDIHGTTHFQTLFRNHFYGDIWNDPRKDTNTQDRPHPVVREIFQRRRERAWSHRDRDRDRTSLPHMKVTEATQAPPFTRLGDSPNSDFVPEDPHVRRPCCGGRTTTRYGDEPVSSCELPMVSVNSRTRGLTQTLPPSFYLAAKPSWFGDTPWPAIGPDVTGGQHTDGHAYKIPARVCWEETPIDGSYGPTANVRLFNPDECYGQAQGGGKHGKHAPKSAPAHLKATASRARVTLTWRPVPRASQSPHLQGDQRRVGPDAYCDCLAGYI